MTTSKSTRKTVQNPILKGFNPDPSILRVEKDYYIATSTFEWFPGVQIHHSTDLVNWKLIKRPLERKSQLDMIGNPDSGGVWAPCLSHHDGVFYLIYTDVKAWKLEPYKIAYNYLVTATDIMGPWSEPVFLNSSGFDPSLFHDDYGRKWYVNQIWDHRKDANRFAGIVLQEFCPQTNKLVGPVKNIFKGTDIALVEGPHIYKRNGYYYLMTAEGGTMYEHAVTLARSKNLDGPYELHPQNPILTSQPNPKLTLQKAGHASFVETENGALYLAHLCGRPTEEHCILGRETALQEFQWDNDEWPRLKAGGNSPIDTVEALPGTANIQPLGNNMAENFETEELSIHFQSLRQPIDPSWLSLTDHPGHLRLYGAEPTTSNFRQSMLARRLQSKFAEAETSLEFVPEHFQQMAGLTLYYDTRNHYYLRVSRDEQLGRSINIIQTDCGESHEIVDEISLPEEGSIRLGIKINDKSCQFWYATNDQEQTLIGPELNTKIVSDEHDHLGFTGAFIGMCAQDISGTRLPADFKYFNYNEN